MYFRFEIQVFNFKMPNYFKRNLISISCMYFPQKYLEKIP